MPHVTLSYTENAVKALDSAFRNFNNVILLGDLNFNMLVQEKSAPLTELCDIFNLTNIVKEPTCFPKNSNPSLVDVILTNNPKTFNGTRICDTGPNNGIPRTLTNRIYRNKRPRLAGV